MFVINRNVVDDIVRLSKIIFFFLLRNSFLSNEIYKIKN